ncbi:unnamed protein product [Closterium sp. Naga37s-1]|nr:unnamed protein product [Closterium sp. Naga37s-1]
MAPNYAYYFHKHEGLAGREGTVVPGELAADAAEAGAAETDLAAAADAAEPGAAALLEEADVAAAAEVTRTAREGTQTAGTAGGVSAAETAAASDDGLTSPAVVRPTEPPLLVGGGRAAEECQTLPELAASPSPLGTAEVAAVVAEAGRRQQLPPNAETAPRAAESAGTSVAAVGANRQGHGRAGSGRPAAPTQAPGNQVRATNEAPAVTGTTAAAAGTNIAAAAVGTRRSARLGAITWGPPRGGRTPWMPAGRGGNGAAETAGAAGRGQRGVLRGGMRGGRGGRNQPPRSEIPVRTGPWRERHARPERMILQTNEGQEVYDNPGADPEFMAGEEETSEEISLEDEEAPRRRNNPEPQTGEAEAAGGIPSNPAEGGAPATKETDVPSPADLAGDDAIWHMAGEWDVNVLQRGDQPFLVRRLPPHLLDRYGLCMLAALLRLDKNPSCPGGWMVLLFLPRLTLMPTPEPVLGSRWAAIEARLHKFQRGDWSELFEEAGVIPDTGAPFQEVRSATSTPSALYSARTRPALPSS